MDRTSVKTAVNPILVVVIVVALVALATVVGVVYRTTAGPVRHTKGNTIIRANDLPGLGSLGSRATLLQFSTEVCAPCRTTHRVLHGVAEELPGVTHVDLDVTHLPDVASKYNLLQTPTTFILDRRGVVRARIGGLVRTPELRDEIARVLLAA